MPLRCLSALLVAASLWVCPTAHAGEVRFDGEGHAYHPMWSVDGKFLAFEVNRYAGDVDLMVSQVTGEHVRDGVKVSLPGGSNVFGGTGQVVVNPSWQKDGYVVFEGSNQGGNFRIYTRKDTGGNAGEVISTDRLPGDLTFPTVSPDGRTMAFVADATGGGDLRTRDTQTNQLSQLTRTPASEMFPIFSSDGTKLLFTRKQFGGEDVFELTARTGVEQPVVGGTGDQTRPVYGAGGRVLFFDGSRGEDRWDVVSYSSADGRKVLAREVRLPLRARPAVSADGRWVAYTYNDPAKGGSVHLSAVDGSKAVEIDTGFTACGEPALTVQSGRTLLAFTALPTSGSDWRFLFVLDITERL
ncbi:MAG: hypothetical protein KTR31_15950 [Myxococcales bacterium]|nr:hypothetical protein [Myxococcales bacterium]